MSEKTYTHHRHEQDKPNHELEDHSHEILKELAEKGHEAEQKHSETKAERIDQIRLEALQEARPAEEMIIAQQEQAPDAAPSLVGRDLKEIKYKRTLQGVRKHLNVPEKALSSFIHNPVVDAVSEAAEATIARPSGLLSGSMFAFLGSSTFLYIAKHYGYEYNYLLMALFFFGGFAIGLVIELILRTLRSKSKS